MDTIELRGKPVMEHLREDILKRIEALKGQDIIPKFCLLRIGERDDDISYERAIRKNCEKLGIDLEVVELPMEISMEDLREAVNVANNDENVHGIMLFRPVPKHLDEREVSLLIDENKDVDSMNPINIGKIFEGNSDGFVPCTPQAVIEMLEFNNFEFEGANVVVIGRSLVVGKPLAMLFLDKNSTVTICHSRTKDLKEITKRADVVVAASGKAKFIDSSYFNEDTIVIDVGVNVDEEGKLCGDVDYEDVFGKVKGLTPVPGGVGTITTTILMDQIVKACENQKK